MNSCPVRLPCRLAGHRINRADRVLNIRHYIEGIYEVNEEWKDHMEGTACDRKGSGASVSNLDELF